MNNLSYYDIMNTEVVADCYSGENCDEVKKQFKTYCDGDMESDIHLDDIVIRLSELPVGARIKVEYPGCPECDMPRFDIFKNNKIVGHADKCDCGFDWNQWILNNYS